MIIPVTYPYYTVVVILHDNTRPIEITLQSVKQVCIGLWIHCDHFHSQAEAGVAEITGVCSAYSHATPQPRI